MLFCKDLGGSHQGDLIAAVQCDGSCCGGNQGFSRADITMEQAVHRAGGNQVGLDFFDGFLLIRGRLEGEAFEEFCQKVLFQSWSGSGRADLWQGICSGAPRRDSELLADQPLEREVTFSSVQRLLVRREVDVPQCIQPARPSKGTVRFRGRKQIGEEGLQAIAGVADESPVITGGDAAWRGVDRYAGTELERITLSDHLMLRVIHKKLTLENFRGAENEDLGAGREAPREVRHPEPPAGQRFPC